MTTTAAPPDSPLPLLQAMVRIDTVNAAASGRAQAEAPLTEYLETFAGDQGWTVRRMPVGDCGDNLLVTFEVAADRPWLLFDSHMDTVTVEGMTIDPFAAEVREGKVLGRGTCDTKGTGAAMLWALRRYATETSQQQPNNIAILFSIDEEYGMTGVRSFIARDYPQLGFTPRGVIVGEPTMLAPIIAHNGVVRWRVTCEGVAAHSADPSKGISAISKMVKVITAIESRYVPSLNQYHPLTGKAQCSVNLIRGGSQINIVPNRCSIDIDRRTVPGESSDDVMPAVQAILDELIARDRNLKVTQEPIFACPPLAPAKDTTWLGAVQQALADLKLPTEASGVAYATNAGDLAQAGIPVIVLGPGDIAQAHTRDEFLAIEQLERGVEVYLRLMRG